MEIHWQGLEVELQSFGCALSERGGLELARTRATVTDPGDRLGCVQAYLGLRYLKHMCAKNQIPELSKIWSSFGLWSH